MNERIRIFGARLRRRYNYLLALATFVVAMAPFASGLLIVHLIWPDESGIAPLAIAGVALVLAPLGTWLVYNRLALGGNAVMRWRLRERIESEGHSFPEGVEPVFVGFSPGDEPLIWDGDTDRDIGFLAAWGDSLVYYGDDFEWHLPRDRIDIIEPMQPIAGVRRIMIRWHAPRESNRAFTIASREARDLRGASRATDQLLQQLYAWVSRPSETNQEAPRLGMPPTDASGGRPIDSSPGGSCVVMLAVLAATVVGAWQVSAPWVEEGRYSHAILASGCIFVLGFTLLNAVLRLVQWAEEADRADGAASSA